MDDLRQIDFKVFAKDAPGPERALAFMSIFQRWIQDHTFPGILVDAVDYSHMHHGPGVLLVAHEYNVSIDYTDGRPGLLFHFKLPEEKSFRERVQAALKLAYRACKQLEDEEEFEGQLVFDPANLLFIANDRLLAPNDDAAYERIAPVVREEVEVFLDTQVDLERKNDDPRDRLTIAIRAKAPIGLETLVAKTAS